MVKMVKMVKMFSVGMARMTKIVFYFSLKQAELDPSATKGNLRVN